MDLATRALYAGIPYSEIGRTTLREIDLRYRAKQLEAFDHAKTLLELKLSDMSARSLGEAEDKADEKSDEEKANEKRWEARGREIKAEIRRDLTFAFMPEHLQAQHVRRFGWPGEGKPSDARPLQGVSRQTAQAVLELVKELRFSYGAWAKSAFWEQYRGAGEQRLKATAERKEG